MRWLRFNFFDCKKAVVSVVVACLDCKKVVVSVVVACSPGRLFMRGEVIVVQTLVNLT